MKLAANMNTGILRGIALGIFHDFMAKQNEHLIDAHLIYKFRAKGLFQVEH